MEIKKINIKRTVSFILLIIFVVYIGFSYISYIKITKKLEYVYSERPFDYNIIDFPLHKLWNHKPFPTEKEMRKYLENLDTILFAKNNYYLNVDKDKRHVVLYSFYPSNKDVKMKNYINLMIYNGEDYSFMNYNFLDYLWKDYNALFLDNSYKYKKDEDIDVYIWTITR